MPRGWLLLIVTLIAALMLLLWGGGRAAAQPQADQAGGADPKLVGYGVGFHLGREVHAGIELDRVDLDLEQVIRGFADGLKDADPAFDPQTLDDVLAQVHRAMQDRMVERLLAEDEEFRKIHDDNLARSLAYLEENAKKEGVVTRPSGVQYRVVIEGDGPIPDVAYDRFTFRHVDVMGSGRFFYASPPQRVTIDFDKL